MNKTELIRTEMIKAMKSKDKTRKDALSMLLSVLKNAQIEKRAELTDAEADAVIKKEIKQVKETYDSAPESRPDIREDAAARLAIYKEFVPADMDSNQILSVIHETLKELGLTEPSAKDKGKIMKVLMPKVKGKADGKLVNEVLGRILK